MENHEMCKNCGRKLVVRMTRKSASQLKKPYYYTAYYFCPHCERLYHDDKFKVVNEQAGLFENVMAVSEPEVLDSRFRENDESVRENDKEYVDIWTDGACVFNGTEYARAAWAFVSDDTERAGLVEGKQTNNVAEGLAIYNALVWAASMGYKKIRLHTDSQISLFNLQKPSRLVKMNREIFEAIEDVIATNKLKVTYIKVLGHSGDINNERADRLANTLAGKR